jgi:hypothetical protein
MNQEDFNSARSKFNSASRATGANVPVSSQMPGTQRAATSQSDVAVPPVVAVDITGLDPLAWQIIDSLPKRSVRVTKPEPVPPVGKLAAITSSLTAKRAALPVRKPKTLAGVALGVGGAFMALAGLRGGVR